MRTIRSFLPLIAVALVLAACSGSSSSILSTVGAPVGNPVPAAVAGKADGVAGQPPANGAPGALVRLERRRHRRGR